MKPTVHSHDTPRRPLPILGRGAKYSRREVLSGSAAFLAGGLLGGTATAYAAPTPRDDFPPLPWPWATLDPLEAGRRGYRTYKEKGGCGSGSYLSILSLLKEETIRVMLNLQGLDILGTQKSRSSIEISTSNHRLETDLRPAALWAGLGCSG